MIAIAFITFRESLEMLVITGVILTSLRQIKIDKKNDLLFGAIFGFVFSIILFIIFSFAGSQIHFNIGKNLSEIFEGINYLGSGIFLFITAILLHNQMKHAVSHAPSLLLDTSLFAVGFLSVLREGVEIIVFSFSSTILSSFFSSLLGFALGILSTVLVAIIGKQIVLIKFSHKKLLIVADWGIKIVSLYLVAKGVIGLSEFIF